MENSKRKKRKIAQINRLRKSAPISEEKIFNELVQVLPPEHMLYYLGLMFENYFLTSDGISADVRENVFWTYYAMKETLYKSQRLIDWKKENGMHYDNTPMPLSTVLDEVRKNLGVAAQLNRFNN